MHHAEQHPPTADNMQHLCFSARVFNARGDLTACLQDAHHHFQQHGALHIKNTGLRHERQLSGVVDALGFAPQVWFQQGGRTSQRWQQKWVQPGLRRMDHYPPQYYLLPNNEVQYQRFGPQRVFFFCRTPPAVGGRSFLHAARAVEQHLVQTALGRDMVQRMDQHGLMIETGFLDANHPQKAENYFQSWQERFGTDEPALALQRAQQQRDEYDRCWWREEDGGLRTLMTRITLSAFKRDPRDGRRYLRFPRLAMDGPALRNGYRRFPLGNGEEWSPEERARIMDAFLATREGVAWEQGDLILFDNVRYGHSREPFSGPRDVFVGMAGVVWDDAVVTDDVKDGLDGGDSVSTPTVAPVCLANPDPAAPRRYRPIPAAVLWAAQHSMRIFDARGALTVDRITAAVEQFERHGALLITRTGLGGKGLDALGAAHLNALRFSAEEEFAWGGLNCGRTVRRSLSKAFRATDAYPPALWLLPHNEILYQRRMPRRLLFFSPDGAAHYGGGRTFVHAARSLEDRIRQHGPIGAALLDDLREHGYLIEMGFLDERHPDKHKNYFRSWQDRFSTTDRDEALARCQAATLQFDQCWWQEEPVGEGIVTLMTRIRVPAFQPDPRAPQERPYLLFPRIALDGPEVHNGYRRFPLGNGEPLRPEAIDVLLEAFLATREGIRYQPGDLLLVDNIRYGHSREPFQGERTLGVSMAGEFWAGEFWTDDTDDTDDTEAER